MSLIQYILRRPIKYKIQDYRDYRALRARERECRHETIARYNAMLRDFGLVNSDSELCAMKSARACIKMYDTVAYSVPNMVELSNTTIVPHIETCPKLDEVTFKPCTNYNCSAIVKNHEWWNAHNEYERVHGLCKKFWDDKFGAYSNGGK